MNNEEAEKVNALYANIDAKDAIIAELNDTVTSLRANGSDSQVIKGTNVHLSSENVSLAKQIELLTANLVDMRTNSEYMTERLVCADQKRAKFEKYLEEAYSHKDKCAELKDKLDTQRDEIYKLQQELKKTPKKTTK